MVALCRSRVTRAADDMTFFNRVGWRPRVSDEVDEELEFHLAMRTRELVARGIDPDAARLEAARRFGDLQRMRTELRALGHGRDLHMQRTQYLGELWQDITFTWRQLVKNPGFTAVAVLTLALGIGGTTAIFSAVYAVVLQPLPVREPSRLMLVGEIYDGQPQVMSVGNYVDSNAAVTGFEGGLSALNYANFNLSDGATPERVVGARVTANYFDVIGVSPMLGRTFTVDEDQPGNDRVVVLSHRIWARRFGASGSVLGRDVRMNGATYSVVGVMPASFDLTTDSEELWTPIAFTPAQRAMHDEHYLTINGRLKAGRTIEQVQAELDAAATRLRHDFPQDNPTLSFGVVPFVDRFVGDYKQRLLILLAAVALVLLIACGNVANLLLARGATRAREIAVRAALGAGRWRIARQLLTESAILALVAAAVGVAVAQWSIGAVVAWSPPDVPRLEQARIDPLAIAFAVVVALASSVIFGAAPALRVSRPDVQGRLRDGGRGSTGGVRDRVRASLIVAEVALSVLLLFGAGLLIRSAIALQRTDPGFNPRGVLSARLTLPATAYTEPARIVETLNHIVDAAAAIPGGSSVAVTSYAAMGSGGGTNGILAEGKEPGPKNLIASTLRVTTPGFFETMGVPIVRGRNFNDGDRAAGQLVTIVSERLAALAFPGQDPIGKRITCCTPGADALKIIVGVAGNIRSRGPAVEPRPEFYLPLAQAPDVVWNWFRTVYVIVRTPGDPTAVIRPLNAAIARIDPDLPLFDVRTMEQRLSGTLATARFNTLLLTILGGMGLVLAASGIYGVIAYFVSQRTQEIGVRIALGATPRAVVRLVLVQAMRPVAIGTAIGLAAALGASRVLSGQLFGVERSDPLTIAAVTATLVSVALAASAVPARRAADVDPARALQAE
jgi:putative ABC transport system permease protein